MKKRNKIKVFGNPYGTDTLYITITNENGNTVYQNWHYPFELDEIIKRNRNAKVYYIKGYDEEEDDYKEL